MSPTVLKLKPLPQTPIIKGGNPQPKTSIPVIGVDSHKAGVLQAARRASRLASGRVFAKQ